MPEPPDFEQIAGPLIEKLSDTMDRDGARDFVLRTLRQAWNARGAADANCCTGDGMDRIDVLESIQRLDR